ncbi:EF hand domain-containing protein [Caballeronia peredens]|nr:EF hand domain-containing protein [Caballeronia peredens]
MRRRTTHKGDGNGKVTGNELCKSLGQRWLASALSHIAVRYESEWGGSMSKWDALSSCMGTGRYIWQGELERIQKLQWWAQVKSIKGFPIEPIVWHLHPVGVVGNFVGAPPGALTLEEARVRAFLRMIRVGEGTITPAGYERLFGGQSFIKDYGKDFSDHPRLKITRTVRGKDITSSASGAYQVMGYNWDDPANVARRKKYNITDFSPAVQDRYCVILIRFVRNALEAIRMEILRLLYLIIIAISNGRAFPGTAMDKAACR